MSDQLPSLKDTIRKFGLDAKKSLGQHFLTDTHLLDKIVNYAGDLSGKIVVEIGPGPGGLTRAILKKNVAKLVAVEKDNRCVLALRDMAKIDARLAIIEEDALYYSLEEIAAEGKVIIIANLPYNIGTELLIRWMDELPHIESMILMFQKEVADRITSAPDEKSYGRLSVLCQWLCECKSLFDIPPQAFSPPPKVFSTVIRLKPRSEPAYPANRENLENLTRAVFGQRRKMLRVSLKQLTDNPEQLLSMAGISGELRPETLSVEQFCKLSQSLESLT